MPRLHARSRLYEFGVWESRWSSVASRHKKPPSEQITYITVGARYKPV